MIKQIHTRGFSIPELLVYAAIVGFVLAFVINGILAVSRSVHVSRDSRDLNISVVTALERIEREARDARSIITASSTLGSNPGVLVLSTTNASTTGGYMKFWLSGGTINLVQGTGTTTLTAGNVSISRLVFYGITASNSVAVRTEIAAAASNTPTRTYYDTAVLRESYVQ